MNQWIILILGMQMGLIVRTQFHRGGGVDFFKIGGNVGKGRGLKIFARKGGKAK